MKIIIPSTERERVIQSEGSAGDYVSKVKLGFDKRGIRKRSKTQEPRIIVKQTDETLKITQKYYIYV